MSGPKGYDYSVDNAAELARRAQEAARQRLRTVRALFNVAVAEADGWPQSRALAAQLRRRYAHMPEDTAELTQLSDQLVAAIDQIAESVRQAELDHTRQKIQASLGSLDLTIGGDVLAASTRPAPQHRLGTSVSMAAERQRRLEHLRQVLEENPGVVPDEAAMLARVAQALTTPQAATALRHAETQVSMALRKAQQRREFEEIRDRVLIDTADLEGPRAQLLRETLAATDSLPVVSECDAQLAQLRATQRREADRRFVLTAAREALAELGYSLGSQEEHNGAVQVLARSPEHPDHALKLLFQEGKAAFYTNVVAGPGTTAVQDLIAEQETCQDLDRLARGMARRGVRTSMTFHRPPGAVPVERADTLPVAQTAPAAQATRRTRRQHTEEQAR